MTTLVTGGTGFVGAAVVRRLLGDGQAVRALARPGSDRTNLRGLDIEIVEGDLTDAASLKRAAVGCTALYHVAADYRLWVPDPEAMLTVNVDGTRALLRAAAEAGATRIVYTSSVAALGLTADGSPADETTPIVPAAIIGPYKRSKYLAEVEVRRLVAEEGIPAVIVNPSTPVGPGDVKPTPTGRVILEAAQGRIPAFVDTGLNLAHVDDVAQGHLLAFARGRVGEGYIIGGQNMALGEMLAVVAQLVGRRPPTVRLPIGIALAYAVCAEGWARISGRAPLATVDSVRMARKRMFFTSAKAERELGYAPRPASDGLAEAVAWFRAEGRLGRGASQE